MGGRRGADSGCQGDGDCHGRKQRALAMTDSVPFGRGCQGVGGCRAASLLAMTGYFFGPSP